MTNKDFIKVANGKDDFLQLFLNVLPRYQDFLKRAKKKDVLGYKIPVASIEDIFQGKIWAAMDETRRPSKRQKDLADILRLMEVKSDLKKFLPQRIKNQLDF